MNQDPFLAALPVALRARVVSRLGVNEKIAWIGRALAKPYEIRIGWAEPFAWARAIVPLVIAGAALIFFLVSPAFDAAQHKWGPPVRIGGAVFSVVFVLFGLLVVVFPRIMSAFSKTHIYVLTDLQAFVTNAWWTSTSVRIADWTDLACEAFPHGSGNLQFAVVEYSGSDAGGVSHSRRLGFLAVENVRQVEAIARDLQGKWEAAHPAG